MLSEAKKVTDKTANKTAKKGFSYRNIKKDFTKFDKVEHITTDFHLELGEKNQAVIVQDRNVDWAARADKDVNKVGLANILEIARKRGEDLSKFMFKDEEAMDTSELNPMDPNSVRATIGEGEQAQTKLKQIADQLGVSVEKLVEEFIAGNVESLIAKATENTAKTEEGGNE